MVYFNKEEGKVSDRVYHKLRKTANEWTSLYRARQFRSQMAAMFPTVKTEYGIFNQPRNKIERMIELHFSQIKIDSDTIQIKLSADGAQVGKKAKLLNFTFSFLQQYSQSFVDGNFTLGIFDNLKEDYESIKYSFLFLSC